MRNAFLIASCIAIAAYFGAAALLFTVQRSILFVPDTSRPDAANVGLTSLRQIDIVTPAGLSLLAWWVPPKDCQPVLAYFHGNGGNIGNRRDRLLRFAALGWGVLMPEYPGYGGNPGSPSEAGSLTRPPARCRSSSGR